MKNNTGQGIVAGVHFIEMSIEREMAVNWKKKIQDEHGVKSD